jgi:hypothetical protein
MDELQDSLAKRRDTFYPSEIQSPVQASKSLYDGVEYLTGQVKTTKGSEASNA